MSEKIFRGVYTAIITPFGSDGSIDYPALKNLIEIQIASGIEGIVPCGTTGESPTLDHAEHKKVIDFVIHTVNKRCKVIAGTGSNSTKEAIELSKSAEAAGADALLLVNPYYNKPTQEGLFRHFSAIASAVKIPLIVYNIKGRTGVNVETATLMRIAAACPNVLGVKEASGDLNQIKDVLKRAPKNFAVLAGDDNVVLELVKNGGDGVISVASNVAPKEMVEFTSQALAGNTSHAQALHERLTPLFEAEFIETNPIPIKFMLAQKKLCQEVYRLPLCELSAEHKQKVLEVMRSLQLL